MFDYVSLAKSTRGHSYKLFVNRMHSRVYDHFIKIASYVLNPGQCFKSKLEQFTFSLHILGRTKVIIAIITLDGRKRLAPVYYLLYVYVLIASTR